MRLDPCSLPGSPAAGDIAVDSGDGNKLKWYDGSGWQSSAVGSAGGWSRSGTNTYLTNSGDKVGMGTSSPTYKLHIKETGGDNTLFIDAAANSIAHLMYGVAGVALMEISYDPNTGTDGSLIIKCSPIAQKIYIDRSTCFMGIGVSSPDYPLVIGGVNSPALQFKNGSSSYVIGLDYNDNDSLKIGSLDANASVTILTKGAHIGYVGIKTTDPGCPLDVNGNINSYGNIYAGGYLTTGGSGGPEIKSGAGAPNNNDNAPKGSLYLRTDGGTSTTLYVKTDTNVWTAK